MNSALNAQRTALSENSAQLCCPLCGTSGLTLAGVDNRGRRERRAFYRCRTCELISVPQEYWLSAKDEKRRYGCHDNYLQHAGYCHFLSVTAGAVTAAIDYAFPNHTPAEAPTIKLLDFGCGRNAVLGDVLERAGTLTERGIDYYGYDPLYDHLPLPDVEKFDIIVACEVIEHLRDIRGELTLMGRLIQEGGAIVLRTQTYRGPISEFIRWHYASDPTHINFFDDTSLKFAAELMGKQIKIAAAGEWKDIFLLT